MTNTKLLREEIEKSGLRIVWIAGKLGITRYALYKKIRNEHQFKPSEIKALCKILNITSLELKEEIFFAEDVDKMTT